MRHIIQTMNAQPTSDGAGVNLYRSLGSSRLPDLDPFLLLDEFKSDQAQDYLAGFPPHPHRGFETVTYMLAGAMRHKDSQGNTGHLRAGSVQWMTAARGIIHEEMPEQEDGLMWGFQLWVNLPAKAKMEPPRYQDIPPSDIPEAALDNGGRIRVIAGESHGVSGAVQGIATAPLYVDIRLPKHSTLTHPVPSTHNALVYVFEGEATFGPTEERRTLQRGQLGVLSKGEDSLTIQTQDSEASLLLLAGQPLKEPIVKYGPFVMNTQEEIFQAIRDYQSGNLVG